MNIEKWIKENAESLSGKTIAITGSTGGLGRHIANYVASLGGNLLLLDRNIGRSREHAQQLCSDYQGITTKSIQVDMVDISSVKSMCEKIKDEKIDFLILNAGAYSLPREKATTGYDQVFQINFLSPYYIVRKLLPNLRANKTKVVVVGSISHKFSKIDENDVDFSKVKAPRKVYGNAKRFLMFSLQELLKNEKDVSFVIAHPGISPTNITSQYSKFISAIIKIPMKIMFTSPKKASLNIIKGVFSESLPFSWIGPRVFNIWGKPKMQKIKSCNQEESQKIFEIAENIYEKINAGENPCNHVLGLKPEYFELVKNGIKLFEGRINDEKRRLINVGDFVIIKKDPERVESFKVKVVDKLCFKSFKSMAQSIDCRDLGLAGLDADQIEQVYRKFYSEEEENRFGVVALKLEVV